MVQKLEVYYGDMWVTIRFQILLVVSTQLIGFGFAGILRRLAVYPVRAMWPTLLPTIALNRALNIPEQKESINGWKMTRAKFIMIFFILSFLYFWFPSYLFQALFNFNCMCWIATENLPLNVMAGMNGMVSNPIALFEYHNLQLSIGPPFLHPSQHSCWSFICLNAYNFWAVLMDSLSTNQKQQAVHQYRRSVSGAVDSAQ